MNEESTLTKFLMGSIGLLILSSVILVVIAVPMWVAPKYRVYSQTLRGEASLKEQEYAKQIAVEEAKAEKESATLLAEAEVERAYGVAKANEIIGDSLKGNEAYLKYLMIQTLEDQETSLIYVPTESNLPILEADRFNQQ